MRYEITFGIHRKAPNGTFTCPRCGYRSQIPGMDRHELHCFVCMSEFTLQADGTYEAKVLA